MRAHDYRVECLTYLCNLLVRHTTVRHFDSMTLAALLTCLQEGELLAASSALCHNDLNGRGLGPGSPRTVCSGKEAKDSVGIIYTARTSTQQGLGKTEKYSNLTTIVNVRLKYRQNTRRRGSFRGRQDVIPSPDSVTLSSALLSCTTGIAFARRLRGSPFYILARFMDLDAPP